MRKKILVGNWKLQGSLAINQLILNRFKAELAHLFDVDVVVCVPYIYLFQVQELLKDSNIAWGAQNISQYQEGPHTSCISANMVAESGASYTIIGHSERRALKLENSRVALKRVLNALNAGLTPIFCVGETLDDRENGLAELVVKNQLLNLIQGLDDANFNLAKKLNIVIAYEPVWAIGAKQSASANIVQAMHQLIRFILAERDQQFAEQTRIIYGGSVSLSNSNKLLNLADVDGGLLGRSSFVADDLISICSDMQKYIDKGNLQSYLCAS